MEKFINKLEDMFIMSLGVAAVGMILSIVSICTVNCVLFWIGVGMGFMPISILSVARSLDKIYEHREGILDWMLGLNVWASTQGLAATIALFAIVSGVTIVLWALGLLEGYWMLVAAVAGGVTVCIPFLIELLTDIPLKKAGWIRED